VPDGGSARDTTGSAVVTELCVGCAQLGEIGRANATKANPVRNRAIERGGVTVVPIAA